MLPLCQNPWGFWGGACLFKDGSIVIRRRANRKPEDTTRTLVITLFLRLNQEPWNIFSKQETRGYNYSRTLETRNPEIYSLNRKPEDTTRTLETRNPEIYSLKRKPKDATRTLETRNPEVYSLKRKPKDTTRTLETRNSEIYIQIYTQGYN